ncbi:MAG: hypothetical protein M3417_01745 [Actinomycetota bacterium]|nr:hypothetical protein [Actinomycetota bacterium]
MILVRAVVRLLSFLLLAVLAGLGLVVAAAAVDPSLVTELIGLPQLRDAVGGWFDALAADGPVALASALAGGAAITLGIVMLSGLLVPRRERLVRLRRTGHGTLSARRRPLSQVATHMAEQARGVTHVRAKLKPRRRGGGRLKIRADRSRSAPAGETKAAVSSQLESLTGPFKLKAAVQTRVGQSGSRVR